MNWRDRNPGLAALILLGLASASSANADALLNLSRESAAQAETKTERFPVTIPAGVTKLGLTVQSRLSEGKVTLRVLDPNDTPLATHAWGGNFTLSGSTLKLPAGAQQVRLELATAAARGRWNVLLYAVPPRAALYPLLLAGPLMILVALAFTVGWKLWSHDQWRWQWVGAAIWAVGVALKFACSIPLTKPVLHALEAALPRGAYIAAGALYIGLLTGVFEIGVTLVVALIWRKLAATANRAVSIGVGAGGIEALLLGVAALIGTLVVVVGVPSTESALTGVAATVAATPLSWLAGPLERIIAILCHTSSRTLVMLAIMRRRAAYFWYGFLIMTAIDAVAGVAHLTGAMMFCSAWWIELAILPFAIISVPILRWCLRQWPAEPVTEPPIEPPALPST